MHIIHIVESFAGGVYDFISDLTNHTPQHRHTVVYAKRPNTPEHFADNFPEGTRFIYWKNATREICLLRDMRALTELYQILKQIPDIDILHLHSSKAGFLGRVAARMLGMQDRVIYTSHGVSFLRKDVSDLKRNIFVWLEHLGKKAGGTVVACSRSEMEEFHRHGLEAIFINNAVDCVPAPPPQDPKPFVVGTIGRITYPKNPHLFNQIAYAFSKTPGIEFVWVGDGELREDLNTSNIRVTGWLNRREVARELARFDIYLSTSLWEGLPLSALQAMCDAKPLVLSECVGNRDLVKEGQNGLLYRSLFDAIDFIDRLRQDPQTCRQLGTMSQTIYRENFTFERFIQNYQRLYQTIHRKDAPVS